MISNSIKKMSVVALGVLLITACVKQNADGGELPPEEVLMKSVIAAMQTESAKFDVEGNIQVNKPDSLINASAVIKGRQDAMGKQSHFSADIHLVSNNASESLSLDTKIKITTLGPDEIYLMVDELIADGENPLFSESLVKMFTGKWITVKSNESDMGNSTVSPDPRLLRAQAKVVRVKEELPFTSIDDNDTYHYSVSVDPEKLALYLEEVSKEQGEEFDSEMLMEMYNTLIASGEIWIDADTFNVRKIVWNIDSLITQDGTVISGEMDVMFSDFNNVEPILPPDESISITEAMGSIFGSQLQDEDDQSIQLMLQQSIPLNE